MNSGTHKFHDAAADDPDWLVKQCYTLLIAGANQLENGVENLWKLGDSGGLTDYPDFGKYVDVNTFKCWLSAAVFAFADKKYWFQDKRNMPWDVFFPCLEGMNEKRWVLLKAVIMLMLDESMSGWKPHTSKLGGLPNYTFEPRKPVDLGTMLKNGIECISGILVFQDVVQQPEHQQQKKFQGEQSHLPDRAPIQAHTAEVLRQVEGARCESGKNVE